MKWVELVNPQTIPLVALPSERIAGVDEVGRGALFGPVVAAAVILPAAAIAPLTAAGVTDSKQLAPAKRQQLALQIRQLAPVAVGLASVHEIDRINILQASIKAMHLAIEKLSIVPELLLIDGNRFVPFLGTPHHCVIGGDGIYNSIAAASVLAKTYRDEYMIRLDEEYPHYNWKQNKGYGTLYHRKQIHIHGISPFHRKTFKVNLDKILEPAMQEEEALQM